MRWLLAGVLAAHGIAHLVGFAVSWRLIQSGEVPYHTKIFAGHLDLGADGIRALGLLWVAAAVVFLAAAISWALDGRSSLLLIAVAVAVSTLLCVAEWPYAGIGLVLNAMILALVVVLARAGVLLRS